MSVLSQRSHARSAHRKAASHAPGERGDHGATVSRCSEEDEHTCGAHRPPKAACEAATRSQALAQQWQA